MITLVSIALYLVAVFFAAITGVTAEKFKHSRAPKSEGRFGLTFTLLAFTLAAILQVFA